MTVATLSVFRFAGWRDKAFALGQMHWAKAPLSRVDGLSFFKLCGSGRSFGTPLDTDLSTFALVASWRDFDAADRAFATTAVLRRLQERAADTRLIRLRPISSRGCWGGVKPFGERFEPIDAGAVAPIAALTRAAIRRGGLARFWRAAPDVSRAIAADGNVSFAIGMGELPFRNQATFSIWPSLTAMRGFADGAAHRSAAQAAFGEKWFSEDLFARFAVV